MPISARHNKFVYDDYVSPIPAEFLIKTAEKKQELYDQGRSAIQGQLDAYAQIRNGLVNEADREYFDNQINSLTKEINKNAGLDFSIKGNLNQVLNLSRPLESDTVLLNAVESSNNYNRMLKDYQELDPSKKSSVNDFFFLTEMEKYRNSNEPGKKLHYRQYTPYNKDHIEALKLAQQMVKPITKVEEFTDSQGRVVKRVVVEEVDRKRLKKAVYANLTEQGKTQLQMEALYKIKTEGVDKTYENYMEKNLRYKKSLELDALEIEKYLSKKDIDPTIAQQYHTRLADIQNELISVNSIIETPVDKIPQENLTSFIIEDRLYDLTGFMAYSKQELPKYDELYLKDYEQLKTQQNMILRDSLENNGGGDEYGSEITGNKKTNVSPGAKSEYDKERNIEVVDFTPVFNSNYIFGKSQQLKKEFSTLINNIKEQDKDGNLKTGNKTIGDALKYFSNENNPKYFNTKKQNELLNSIGIDKEQFLLLTKKLGASLNILPEKSYSLGDPKEKIKFKDKDLNPVEINDGSTLNVTFAKPNGKTEIRPVTTRAFKALPAERLLDVINVQFQYK